jgi:chaperonin cofactor prefoldin
MTKQQIESRINEIVKVITETDINTTIYNGWNTRPTTPEEKAILQKELVNFLAEIAQLEAQLVNA